MKLIKIKNIRNAASIKYFQEYTLQLQQKQILKDWYTNLRRHLPSENSQHENLNKNKKDDVDTN